jgi:hypothetical protein
MSNDESDKPDASDKPVVPEAKEPGNATSAPREGGAKLARKMIILSPAAPVGDAFDSVIAALASVPNLYRHAGTMVTVDPVTAAITPVDQQMLTELITRVCEVLDQRGDKLRPVTVPPQWLLRGVLGRRVLPGFRPLNDVLPHPSISIDGTVLTKHGYYTDGAGYGLVLARHGLTLQVKHNPSRADARQALRLIIDLVVDIPFATPMHRAAWISTLLTAITAAAHGGNLPATIITSDLRGTGKTKLAQLTSVIITGKEAATEAWRGGAELRKSISTAVLDGKRLIIWDNVTTEVRGDALDIVLTSRIWRDRILGSMRSIDMLHSLQPIITGNHVQVASDTTRRVIGVRLKARDERPELRTDFRHADILGYAREHRAELLSAVLTIVRAYVMAGRPPVEMTRLGSYETWCDWVCAPLIWLGQPNPIDTQEEYARGASSDAAKLGQVVEAWSAAIGEEPITVADLRDALRSRAGDGEYRTLRDALTNAGCDIDNSIKLAKQLEKFENRKTEGWTLGRVGMKTRGNAVRWGLVRVWTPKGAS